MHHSTWCELLTVHSSGIALLGLVGQRGTAEGQRDTGEGTELGMKGPWVGRDLQHPAPWEDRLQQPIRMADGKDINEIRGYFW